MDYLWSPWRYQYVAGDTKREGCIFCEMKRLDPRRDPERLILYRGQFNLVVLNLYPYTSGHLMVAPYAHVASLVELDHRTLAEMMSIGQRVEAALERAYHPDGYNLGMNLGRSAGAGVADHLHLHFLPRWRGDTNFMTVIGETRVLPEDLSMTYRKLAPFFQGEAAESTPGDRK
jgi:ATP adenylyltransferase